MIKFKKNKTRLTFYGGSKIVTGCNYLLEAEGLKILIECGLIQDSSYQPSNNYSPFPYDPKEIDVLLVTHGHIDHIGRIPKLYKDGFRGKILATRPTIDISHFNLLDGVNILKNEARVAGVTPLYKLEHVNGSMNLFESVEFGKKISLNKKVSVEFNPAGHILGSSTITINVKGKKILFSGDLGNSPSPLIQKTKYMKEADYLITESTYGDRNHIKPAERIDLLKEIITKTIKRKGVLMIPAFAVERTQELLYELNNLIEKKIIPKIPVFLDSPLAINMTQVYNSYSEYFSKKAKADLLYDHEIFNFPGLNLTYSTEESKSINNIKSPKIVIAGSGMSTGGRILHHEARYLPGKKNTLLLVGFQVYGSLGRKLVDGFPEVKIAGKTIKVKAEIVSIRSYSAHADQKGLLKFVSSIKTPLKKVFIVQGEEEASTVLAEKINQKLGIETCIPNFGDSFEL